MIIFKGGVAMDRALLRKILDEGYVIEEEDYLWADLCNEGSMGT